MIKCDIFLIILCIFAFLIIIMKKLIQKLKIDRVINRFLDNIVITVSDSYGSYMETDIYYRYNGDCIIFYDGLDDNTFVYIDKITKVLDMEHNIYLINRIISFVDKAPVKIMLFDNNFDIIMNLDEYKNRITQIKI